MLPSTTAPQRSRWAHLLNVEGRRVVVHGLTMRAAELGEPLAERYAAGRPLPAEDETEHLRRLGLAGSPAEDERAAEALRHPAWAAPVLDLFVVPPVTSLGRSLERQLDHLTESIREARAAHACSTVKLRLCGATRADAARNARTLAAARAVTDELGVSLISLLMGEALHDACGAAQGPAVDAYFFRWRPAAREHDAPALDAVRALLAQGKLVAIQLALAAGAELAAHTAALAALALDRELTHHPNLAWDVALVEPGLPFFAAATCQRQRCSELDALRAELTALGLPLRPALAPYSLHPGCPLLLAGAHVLLPSGRRAQCMEELTGTPCEPPPRQAAAQRAASQLASSCAACASVGFCLARCPKLAAPVPGSPECAAILDRTRDELERLVTCGALHPLATARPSAGSPPP